MISQKPSLSEIAREKIRLLDLASDTAGIHSLDLAGRALLQGDLDVFVASMRVALGGWTNADEKKAGVLFKHILDKGWSKEHLDQVLYRFLEKKLYGGKWSLGDFFECDIEADLHSYAWVRSEVAGGHSMKEMEGFHIGTVTLWRYKNNTPLPFEQIAL